MLLQIYYFDATNLAFLASFSASPFCSASMSGSSPEGDVLLEAAFLDFVVASLLVHDLLEGFGFVKRSVVRGRRPAVLDESNGRVR